MSANVRFGAFLHGKIILWKPLEQCSKGFFHARKVVNDANKTEEAL